MKLSELIFEAKIVKEELDIRSYTDGRGRSKWIVFDTDDPDKRVGNTFDSEGAAEEFRDAERARRANPSAEKPKPAKTGIGKPKTTVDISDVKTGKLTSGLSRVGDRFFLSLPDGKTVLEIANEADADKLERILLDLTEAKKSPADITKAMTGSNLDALLGRYNITSTPKVINNPIKRAITKISIADFEMLAKAKGSFAGKLIASDGWKIFTGIAKRVTPLLDPLSVVLGVMLAIDQVQEEMKEAEAQGDSGKLQELALEADILRGQLLVMLVASLTVVLRTSKWAYIIIRFFGGFVKRVINVASVGAVVATGGTAAPAAAAANRIGWLLTEGAQFLVFLLLSNPSFQRWLAQLIAGSILKDVIAEAGSYVNNSLKSIEEQLDGKYGSKFLADNLTTDEKTVGGVDGEYFSNSEWAKLVFGALLFPKGSKTRLVPYIPESKREQLLSNVLGVESVNTPPQLSPRLDTKGQIEKPDPDANDPRGKDQIPPAPGPSVNSGAPGFRPGQ